MPFGTLHSLLLAEHDQQKEELLGNRVRMKSIDKPSYEPDRKPDPNDNPIKRNGKTIKLFGQNYFMLTRIAFIASLKINSSMLQKSRLNFDY